MPATARTAATVTAAEEPRPSLRPPASSSSLEMSRSKRRSPPPVSSTIRSTARIAEIT